MESWTPPEMSSFLLAGRAWTVQSINHSDRTVTVIAAPRGTKPTWGAFMPQLLGFEICRKVREVLASETPIRYLDAPSRGILADFRRELAPLVRQKGMVIGGEPGQLYWWTFAGGQINHTLKYGLALLHPEWTLIGDNFGLKIHCESIAPDQVVEGARSMAGADFWKAPGNASRILAMLPEYRLSKFQDALPVRCAQEMVGAFLLDFNGVVRFLAEHAP